MWAPAFPVGGPSCPAAPPPLHVASVAVGGTAPLILLDVASRGWGAAEGAAEAGAAPCLMAVVVLVAA